MAMTSESESVRNTKLRARLATLEAALAEWGGWLVDSASTGLTVPTNAVAVAMECARATQEGSEP